MARDIPFWYNPDASILRIEHYFLKIGVRITAYSQLSFVLVKMVNNRTRNLKHLESQLEAKQTPRSANLLTLAMG